MARPAKGMTERERKALEALVAALEDGRFVYDDHRLGIGVLRELQPEFAQQLIPRRGQQPANDRKRRVLNHFEILSNPRYRESPTSPRGALPQSDIVARIASAEGITEKHVRELLADELSALRAASEAVENHRIVLRIQESEERARHGLAMLADYLLELNALFDRRSVKAMSSFASVFEVAHNRAVAITAKNYSVDPKVVFDIVDGRNSDFIKRLENETRESLRFRI